MPQSMANDSVSLSAVDVYDIAASIGKEFEKVIDNYGPEAVAELMPKIISVLERLEVLTNNNQKENAEIAELNYTIERLHSDKKAKAEERERYEQELEQIEESWKKETEELTNAVSRLQGENHRLRNQVQDKQPSNYLQNADEGLLMEMEQELSELRSKVHTQQEHARALQREVAQKKDDMDDMQNQIDRLNKVSAEFKRKNSITQRRSQSLIQDKADLQAQLHDKDQQMTRIRERLQEQSNPSSEDGISPNRTSFSEEELMKLEERLELEGKMLIDLSDPNRPRFTLNELREVLTERNELKCKLLEAEEELQQYRPSEPKVTAATAEDYDLPVQGPINKEPEDKLFPGKNKESGIRRFFKFLVSPSKPMNTPPHRRRSVQTSEDARRHPLTLLKRPSDPAS